MSQEQTDGWIRWDETTAKSANWNVTEAVQAFEPVQNEDGEECARWLKEAALYDYPRTITWVLCNAGVLEGFFAMCSGTLELELAHSRPNEESQSVKWPCSVIKWMCRRHGKRPDGTEYDGLPIINHAIYRAKEVAEHQGNVALFIEPSNPTIAGKLEHQYPFLRRVNEGQLWMPIFDEHQLLVPNPE
jgi:hypothetical protein